MNEDIKFVKARFKNFRTAYTYKTTLDLKPGEEVIVDTPSNGLAVVTIIEIGIKEPDFKCKWIVSQIDLTYYESLPK
jgi:hypothetical protein